MSQAVIMSMPAPMQPPFTPTRTGYLHFSIATKAFCICLSFSSNLKALLAWSKSSSKAKMEGAASFTW